MDKETPAQIVLVPEILEAILLELPIQDLLVNAQRVNHAWKTTIDSSPALQQALFFESSPTSSPSQYLSLNPLLQRTFPPWFRTTYGLFRQQRFIESIPWASSPEARAAFMRADASWRKMLPCQPAKMVLEVAGKKAAESNIFYELNGRVRFESGIRMGHLYDLGFENVKKFVSSFWIQWGEGWGDEAYGRRAGTDQSEERQEREEIVREEEKVTMFTAYSTFQSGPWAHPDLGEEFKSEAYEELAINMREERRSRRWHQGFEVVPMVAGNLDRPLHSTN